MVYDIVAGAQKIGTNILTTENTEGTEAAAPQENLLILCGAAASVPSVFSVLQFKKLKSFI